MLSGHHCRSLSSVTCDAAAASSPAHAMKIIRLRTLSFFAFLIGLVLSGRADQPEPTRVFVCAHSFMIFTSKLPPHREGRGFFLRLGGAADDRRLVHDPALESPGGKERRQIRIARGELNTLLEQIAWDAVSAYPMSGVKPDAAKVQQQ